MQRGKLQPVFDAIISYNIKTISYNIKTKLGIARELNQRGVTALRDSART